MISSLNFTSEIAWDRVEYPLELYCPLDQDDSILLRITLIRVNQHFQADIDIVYAESKKIARHIDGLYRQSDPAECLALAVQTFRQWNQRQGPGS